MTNPGTRDLRTSAYGVRALAHPLRGELIGLLDLEGSAPATRCAEVLGESVASCSYHLGILAKYDYVELVPGITGREKPWQLTTPHQTKPGSHPFLGRSRRVASIACRQRGIARSRVTTVKATSLRRGTRSIRVGCRVPSTGSSVFVTSDELRGIKEEMTSLLRRYDDRQLEQNGRPADARRSRVFFSTSVDPRRGD
jgi:hypothetical protein